VTEMLETKTGRGIIRAFGVMVKLINPTDEHLQKCGQFWFDFTEDNKNMLTDIALRGVAFTQPGDSTYILLKLWDETVMKPLSG
jgi:hypothetical protein